jgi:hypothetical protein
MLLRISLLLWGLLLGRQAPEAPHWHLVKEGHGIKVYTAGTGTSDFKSIKAVAVLDGTLEGFLAILLDVKRQPDWVYATSQAYLVTQVSKRELVYYVETNLPWPADNRDAVIRMKIKENPAGSSLTITSMGEPRALPPRDGKVRVPHFVGRWEVKAAGKNKISLTYLLEVNPGGSLSPMIVNLFTSKGPYETFRNLSALLKN